MILSWHLALGAASVLHLTGNVFCRRSVEGLFDFNQAHHSVSATVGFVSDRLRAVSVDITQGGVETAETFEVRNLSVNAGGEQRSEAKNLGGARCARSLTNTYTDADSFDHVPISYRRGISL